MASDETVVARAPVSASYSALELMACVAARELRDGEAVFVGIGLPNLACNLARLTHAPNLVLIYESGAVGAVPDRLPLSIGDPALVTGALMVCSMADVFQLLLQNGRIDVGFLGGAQIDRYGNINTTTIGPYSSPKVRLPGSGGAPEIAIHARRTLIISPLNRRTFPERVDFVTSPGRPPGMVRGSFALPGQGPVKVITDKCVLAADNTTGEWMLSELFPGVAADDVAAGVGWRLGSAPRVATVNPPTARELTALREHLDPERRFLGRQ